MRRITPKACLFSAICLVLAQHAWADSMRCGNKLIQQGDSTVTVQASCRPPASVEQSFTKDNVPMEIWTYNLGPDKFLIRMRVINGAVVEIKTLHEYGH